MSLNTNLTRSFCNDPDFSFAPQYFPATGQVSHINKQCIPVGTGH